MGAGTGAVAGGVKGGVGLAGYLLEEGFRVMALAAVNSLGRPFDPLTGRLYAEGLLAPEERALLPDLSRYRGSPEDYRFPFLLGQNTTLAVVATDAPSPRPRPKGSPSWPKTASPGPSAPPTPLWTGTWSSPWPWGTGKGWTP